MKRQQVIDETFRFEWRTVFGYADCNYCVIRKWDTTWVYDRQDRKYYCSICAANLNIVMEPEKCTNVNG